MMTTRGLASTCANVEPRPPRDVVPTPGLTREALEVQSARYEQPCTGHIPGEVLTDPDGNLLGMTASREVSGTFGGVFISQADADRLGIEPGELPGISIIDLDT